MIFDPSWFSREVHRWIQLCHEGVVERDPLEALVEVFRTQAKYHESIKDERLAQVAEQHAALLECVLDAIRTAEVCYDTGQEIGVWARGTIKNKKPEMDNTGPPASRGKVCLGSLPLKPDPYRGVHALRAVDLLKGVGERRNSESNSKEEQDDQDWALRAHEKNRAG